MLSDSPISFWTFIETLLESDFVSINNQLCLTLRLTKQDLLIQGTIRACGY